MELAGERRMVYDLGKASVSLTRLSRGSARPHQTFVPTTFVIHFVLGPALFSYQGGGG